MKHAPVDPLGHGRDYSLRRRCTPTRRTVGDAIGAVAAPELHNRVFRKRDSETEIILALLAGMVADLDGAAARQQQHFARQDIDPSFAQRNDLAAADYQHHQGLVDGDTVQALRLSGMEYPYTAERLTRRIAGEVFQDTGAQFCEELGHVRLRHSG